MSEVSPEGFPEPPSSDQGQPAYSHYRRPGEFQAYGSADRLQALVDAYFGLNNRFLIYVVLYLAFAGFRMYAAAEMPADDALLVMLGGFGALCVASFFLSLAPNRRLAEGKGQPQGQAFLYSLVVAALSWLCCGAIGFLIPQSIAAAEIKKYGLQAGAFKALRKHEAAARIQEMRMAENASNVAHPPAGGPGFQP